MLRSSCLFINIVVQLIVNYYFLGSKMLSFITVVLVINTPSIWAWDSDQMEVFDLVEEMNNINFYQFLEVPEVSIVILI
jgi:hypothetical protein